jgi:hypothetical protein
MAGPSQESNAQMLLRRDNEHWDRRGCPHPKKSLSKWARHRLRVLLRHLHPEGKKKKARARSTRNSKKKMASSSSSCFVTSGKMEATGSDDDDDFVDVSV